MRTITWILAALQILSALGIMVLVLLQRSKESDGLTPNMSSNNTSGMGMSRENILSKWTGILGTLFVILTIAVSTMMVIDLK